MRQFLGFSLAFALSVAFFSCAAADDGGPGSPETQSDESVEQQEALKACPFVVPECSAPCKLVGRCPSRCVCPPKRAQP